MKTTMAVVGTTVVLLVSAFVGCVAGFLILPEIAELIFECPAPTALEFTFSLVITALYAALIRNGVDFSCLSGHKW